MRPEIRNRPDWLGFWPDSITCSTRTGRLDRTGCLLASVMCFGMSSVLASVRVSAAALSEVVLGTDPRGSGCPGLAISHCQSTLNDCKTDDVVDAWFMVRAFTEVVQG